MRGRAEQGVGIHIRFHLKKKKALSKNNNKLGNSWLSASRRRCFVVGLRS